MSASPTYDDAAAAALREEFGDAYLDRTCLVTGADGFMGSHLTEALVELGAKVVAFVRATSSGALNNIGHLRNEITVVFADLTDKTSIDYLIRDHLLTASDKPYVFHLGAQAHVGESWHRPYETVMANTVGTLNLLQSIVDHRVVLEKFDTAGTSEEYGNVNPDVEHHHDFDDAGSLILHERSPINPNSIYATAKVAADFLTMNYHDAYGVPSVVTRMFNNYGPRQNPRYVTGTIITQALARPEIELGALDPLRDFCFCTDGVRGHLTVAAKGIPGDHYVYGQGKNISMADWSQLIIDVGARGGFWPDDRHVVTNEKRLRPGVTDVMALRVGYEKLHLETGWEPRVSWEDGVLQTIEWYAANRESWSGRVDWRPPPAQPEPVTRTLVTGGGGFLGSHLVERLVDAGHEVFVARQADYDLTRWEDAERLFRDASPELVFHLAAEVGGIGANRANPGRYWYANLMMGAHVLELARTTGVQKLVTLGTICEYPKFAPVPFHEDDLWNGYPEETNAPYGVAKKTLLVGGQSYRAQYGTNAIHLLPVNLYGPRDNFDLETSHVIPALIRKMTAGDEGIVLWGDGSPTREFLYVEDAAEGIALAGELYEGDEPINLGSGNEISIRDLAELIAELTDFDGEIEWDSSKPNGQPRRNLDVTRARERFGFEARTSLRDGLATTIAWYRDAVAAAA